MDLIKKYDEKFNSLSSKVRIDESWIRYFNDENSTPVKRYKYSINNLYGNVLDVGSADGFGAYLMTKNENISLITGLEIQESAIEISRNNLKEFKNINIVKGIAEDMTFEDNEFDSVHCGQTLEHVFNDDLAVSEIYRVCKDVAVFSVPIMGGVSLQHVKEYKSETDFIDLISKYFNVINHKSFLDSGKKRIVVVGKK